MPADHIGQCARFLDGEHARQALGAIGLVAPDAGGHLVVVCLGGGDEDGAARVGGRR